WFNAWHYVDANLWASLVTYLFEELAKPDPSTVAPGQEERAEREHRNLVRALTTSQLLKTEAEARRDQAKERGDRAEEQLQEIRTRKEQLVRDLDRGRIDLTKAATSPEVVHCAKQAPGEPRKTCGAWE